MRALRIGLGIVFCLALPTLLFSQTQARPSYLDFPARVDLPIGYHPDRSYPLVIYLPSTGGRGADFRRRLAHFFDDGDMIVLEPAGTPQSHHYLPDFTAFVSWYQERLMRDIDLTVARYSVDEERIVLAGFSLGGDLGWALSLLQPQRFAGAVMAGTRASYAPPEGALKALRGNSWRGVFVIGENELPARINGIARAHALIEGAEIETRYHVVPGAGHSSQGAEQILADSLAWVLQPR